MVGYMVSRLNRFNEQVCKLLGHVIGFLLMLLVLLVFSSVLMRYIFLKPIVWSEDASLILLIWMAMLGAPIGTLKGQHIAIDMLVQKFPLPIIRIVKILNTGLTLFIAWIFSFYGFNFAIKGMSRIVSSIDWLPYGYAYLSVPVGFILMLPICLELLIESIQGLRS